MRVSCDYFLCNAFWWVF